MILIPIPCPKKFYKLPAVLFCYTNVFYKLSWAMGMGMNVTAQGRGTDLRPRKRPSVPSPSHRHRGSRHRHRGSRRRRRRGQPGSLGVAVTICLFMLFVIFVFWVASDFQRARLCLRAQAVHVGRRECASGARADASRAPSSPSWPHDPTCHHDTLVHA